MKTILFVTCRNIVTTCGELRLIKNRTATLYNENNIVTDFLALSKRRNEYLEEIGSCSTLRAFYYSFKDPFTILRAYHMLKKELFRKLCSEEYVAVIISGSLMYPLIRIVKKKHPSMRIYADIHGAIEELIEFKKKQITQIILRHGLYLYCKHLKRKYLNKFSDAILVSNGLADYIKREYMYNGIMHIVPCAVQHKVLSADYIKTKRSAAREKYGISVQDVLFVYSGGTSPWQCIDESVSIFHKLKHDTRNENYKMLIMSGDLAHIRQYETVDIIIDSVASDQVPDVLPAADFAFLLRKNFVTNHVAYPNKFLEYVSAGLKIITTPYIDDVSAQTIKYRVGYVLKDIDYEEGLQAYCENACTMFGDDMANRQCLLDNTCFENTMSFFADSYAADVESMQTGNTLFPFGRGT